MNRFPRRLARRSAFCLGIVGAVLMLRVAPRDLSSSNPRSTTWAAPPARAVSDQPVAAQPVAAAADGASREAAGARPAPLWETSGCSASACHGDPLAGDTRDWRSAATAWSLVDPHRRAFAVLYTPRSVEIHDNLRRAEEPNLAAGAELDPAAYARFLSERCIGCHATSPHPESPSVSLAGVTCGSCHPSDSAAWTAGHYLATWKPAAGGSGDTVLARADLCSSCHLGPKSAGGRVYDVDHDLIAAGHPRMVFEYDSLLASYPRHWDERAAIAKRQAATGARFPHLDQWRAGQIAVARRTLDQLEHRGVLGGTPPDFAQFACSDCHHALSPPSAPRPQASRAAARSGAPRPALDAFHSLFAVAFAAEKAGSASGAAIAVAAETNAVETNAVETNAVETNAAEASAAEASAAVSPTAIDSARATLGRRLQRFAPFDPTAKQAFADLRRALEVAAQRGPATAANQRAFARWLAADLRDPRRVDSWETAVERLLAADVLAADVLAAGVRAADVGAASRLATGSPTAGSSAARSPDANLPTTGLPAKSGPAVTEFLAAVERLRSALSDPAQFALADGKVPANASAGAPTVYDTPAAYDPSVIAPLLRALAERLEDPAFPPFEGARP